MSATMVGGVHVESGGRRYAFGYQQASAVETVCIRDSGGTVAAAVPKD